MGLIALLVALAVLYYRQIPTNLQSDTWYSEWYSSLTLVPDGLPRLVVALALPVVGVDVLLRLVDGWGFGLPSLAIAVVVLLYSFGRGDVSEDIPALATDAENGDMQGVYHRVEAILSPLDGMRAEVLDADDDAALSAQAINALSYRFLEHVFAVAFWFFVLGPAAALLYRLLWVSIRMRASETIEELTGNDTDDTSAGATSLARSALYWAEWLPVRALGLILAVVGNLSACVELWLESLASKTSSPGLLGTFVATSFASNVEMDSSGKGLGGDSGSHLAAQVRSLEPLFFRCTLAWLVFVAVLTVSF